MSMKFGLKIHHSTARMMIVVAIAIFGIASVKLVDNALAREQVKESTTAAPNGEKVVTIHDRGQERSIVTTVGTVKEALKAADISVDEKHDVVEPSLDTQLVSTKYNINIYRARPVTVADGTHRVRVVTAQQTTPLIAQAAGVTVYPEDKTTIEPPSDFLLDGADVILKIHRATPLQLTLYGKTTEVRTMAHTVGELLREKNITLGKDDGMSVPESTPITAGMHFSVWRNGKQTVTVEEEIAVPVEQVKDANRETGFKQVKEAGAPGKKNVTYEIEMQDGKEVSRREIASQVTKQPKKQVEIIGIKNAVMPYTGGGNKDQWLSSSNIPRDQWGYAEWLVQKESGWNPNARNPKGACGLAQALPCSKVPGNPLNPIDSLNWMHGYVMERYGSWEKAVTHSKARGWY